MTGRWRSIAGTVAWRHLHNFLSNPALLFPSLIFPLFFFIAFAGGLSALGEAPSFDYPDYTTFQYVFVAIQSAAFGGVFTGFALAADIESGFVRRMMLAAPHRSAIIGGYALAALTRAMLVLTIVTVVGLVSGMQVAGGVADVLGLLLLAVLANLAATLFAAGVALRLRSVQASPLMQMPVFLVLFTAPVWTPRDLLAGWVRAVAEVNPATALLEAGRGFMAGHPESAALAFGSGLALLALFALWARGGMRRAEAAGG